MAEDLLHQPLGQDPGGRPLPRRRRAALWAAGLTSVVVIAAASWWVMHPRTERAGDVVAAIGPAKPAPPAPPAPVAKPDDAADVTGGIEVVRPPGASSPPVGQFIKVPQDMAVSLDPAPDPRLVEQSRFGPLPRRAADGSRPAAVYARPVVTEGGLPANAPRVALMVGGMGLNPALTASAMHDLPAAVTLGFAPYGDNLEQQAEAARAAGHEIVLQLPMEGFGDPASAAMSHLLATGLDGKDLIDRLHWLMGRFTGYAGVANFLGGRFTSDEAALAPVLRDIAGRGLYYLDDGTVPHSLAPDVASTVGLPVALADGGLDDAKDAAALDAILDRLRQRAKDRGCAVIVSGGLPAGLPRIASFARSLAGRGIALVPVSACVGTAGATSARRQP